MSPKQTRFVIIVAVVAASLGFLIYTGTKGTAVYYVTIPELLASEAHAREEGIRVNGRVLPGSIERKEDKLHLRFIMRDPKTEQRLTVEYEGIVPDTFVDDSEVVVEGRLLENGVFKATLLLAKCPSKYEPLVPGEA